MTKLSSILNIVLLVAVGVLYYLHFSGSKKNTLPPTKPSVPAQAVTNGASFPSTAYVDFDSINNNVTFIKQHKKELEEEQKQIMTEYQNAYRQQEADKADFLKRGNSITQQQAEEFQNKWLSKQQEIEGAKQSRGQRLAEKGSKVMDKIQTTIKDFLKEYNTDKNYTYIFATGAGYDYLFYKDSSQNITPEIIHGLNEKMKTKEKN